MYCLGDGLVTNLVEFFEDFGFVFKMPVYGTTCEICVVGDFFECCKGEAFVIEDFDCGSYDCLFSYLRFYWFLICYFCDFHKKFIFILTITYIRVCLL